MLSALAGGGLTAAGLGGPLAGGALAATTTTPVPADGATTSAEQTATTPETTSTATTTTSTTTASAESTPTGTPDTTTTPTATTPQSAATPTPEESEAAPTVVLQRKQKPSASTKSSDTTTQTGTEGEKSKKNKETGTNEVAASPQSIAATQSELAAMLASSEASAQALDFYRIPLFLLPIYKAAAVQYGVPWQILAAINEIETDYGTDLSVSSAGAVGWMQFMPSTWLQYGVDALNAGYADPYNPVDAIFAAARYLRAAGAAKDMRAAILAYNHSEEYVDSVLLRAKLISSYPKAVIATLTGLVDGRLPVTSTKLSWEALPSGTLTASSATANATATTAGADATTAGTGAAGSSSDSSAGTAATESGATAATPGSTDPLSPSAAASAATSSSAAAAKVTDFDILTTAPTASVVAVQDGRILRIGDSRKLGKYIVLRDVYGDVFTYAGLGSIASTYELPKTTGASAKSPVVEAASSPDPTPSQAASAGTKTPVTLQVKSAAKAALSSSGSGSVSVPADSEPGSTGSGKVRLFAHPDNPDARAAAAVTRSARKRRSTAPQRLPLRKGSVVISGTVLGSVNVPAGAKDGHLRFAVKPSGDAGTVDPGPVLDNWAQLQSSLHPKGAKATNALLGATASDVFLLSKAQLQRTVLSDPGITMDACNRTDVAAGDVDKRVLAVLAFLSRSGLKPTVSSLRCGQSEYSASGAVTAAYKGDALSISAINGVAVAGHQGPGTISDLTIRTLLTLPKGFVPHEIISLMRYPGESSTHARSAYWNQIRLVFAPPAATSALAAAATAKAAHSAHTGRTAPSPLVSTETLSLSQWEALIGRIGGLAQPTVATKPSSAAIPDPKRHS